MTSTAKTLWGLGLLLAVAVVVWAMFAKPLNSSTVGVAKTTDTSDTATTTGSQFSSEIKAFDKSADSIDFNSDFSSADIDAAMDAQ